MEMRCANVFTYGLYSSKFPFFQGPLIAFIKCPTVMAPSRIDLDRYKDEIYSRIFEDGATMDDIALFLRNEKQVNVNPKTIQRRCTK
jgi:hypothetical protein